jgi:hypothetical protein
MRSRRSSRGCWGRVEDSGDPPNSDDPDALALGIALILLPGSEDDLRRTIDWR